MTSQVHIPGLNCSAPILVIPILIPSIIASKTPPMMADVTAACGPPENTGVYFLKFKFRLLIKTVVRNKTMFLSQTRLLKHMFSHYLTVLRKDNIPPVAAPAVIEFQ